MAISMFTIIPNRKLKWDEDCVKHIMKSYPIIGLIIGVIWYSVFRLLNWYGVSSILTAALTMITPFILTGMLHLDGFMDVCDALLSRRDREQKIRILKDPNTGAFSVIALVMLFFVQFASIYTLVERGSDMYILILLPIISRGLMGYLLITKEVLPESSLGSYFKKDTGKADRVLLILSIIIATGILTYLMSYRGIVISLLSLFIAYLSSNNSCKELGGMSGDTAGYGLVIAEFTGLLIAAMI